MVENKQAIKRRVAWIDLDDTLWDFKANSRKVLRDLYETYGLASHVATADDWINLYERHNHHLWDMYNRASISKGYLMQQRFRRPLVEAGFSRAHLLGEQFDHEYLDRLAECTILVDGAAELLACLRAQGWETGILSNGFTEVQHRKINNSGLAGLIDYTVLSDDIGVNKPDVRLYRHAESVAGVKADDCIMVGDNPDTDIKGAVDAGWKAIYFSPAGLVTDDAPTARRLADIPGMLPVDLD